MTQTQLLFVAVYAASPFLALRAHRVWGVPAAILCLWIPIEIGLFRRMGIGAYVAAAIAMTVVVLAFWSRRDAFDIRSAFNLSAVELRRALVNLLLFAAIGVPLGLAIGFIRPVFDASELGGIPVLLVVIFLFNALPEEILFRGLFQNWIERRVRIRTVALAIASLVFGAAHLNNGPPTPNYKYMLMAAVAGVFYGRAWRARKNVITSSITHTLVNAGWSLFFR